MASKISFMIADEDKNNILSLKKLIAKVFSNAIVYHAEEGAYAWDFVKKQDTPMIIICDLGLPGINGLQLLQKIKTYDNLKESYFILMIPSNFPKDQLMKVVQMGLDDYIAKPLALEPLVTSLRNGMNVLTKYYTIIEKENEITSLNAELQQSAKQMQEVVMKIQKHRFSDNNDMFDRIIKAADWIYKMMDENASEASERDIETAASMIHIGKLFLPDKSINDPVMINGFAKNETMEQVPKFASELISGIKGFDEVAIILYHLYENYDGSGIPDKIQGWEIPLGSRILRVVLDFEELLISSKKPISKVMEMLDHESKRIYDFRGVTLMDQYLAASGREKISEERPMEANYLKPGNIISRSIITSSGIKLISAGTILQEDKIEKIRNIIDTDPVIGSIWIKIR
jgi:response regulator RpfG family c-di-GMP phosphodiesterase